MHWAAWQEPHLYIYFQGHHYHSKRLFHRQTWLYVLWDTSPRAPLNNLEEILIWASLLIISSSWLHSAWPAAFADNCPQFLTALPQLLCFRSLCCSSRLEECEPKLCPLISAERLQRVCWRGTSYRRFLCKNHYKSWTFWGLLLSVSTQVTYTMLDICTTTDRQETVQISVIQPLEF